MQKRLRSKRLIIKKVTALNLFADQATQIQAIMEATGAQEVAPVMRELLDEALAARRRKSVHREVEQPAPTQEFSETLQTIQTLLLRLIGQGEVAFSINSVNLELLQETLVEARAGRMGLWESIAVPTLKEKGTSVEEMARFVDVKTVEAKDFAYGLAQEIKNDLEATEIEGTSGTTDDEDRQRRLVYDEVEGELV